MKIPSITAKEARTLVEKKYKDQSIDRFVKILDARIRMLADNGESYFQPWDYLASIRTPMPTQFQIGRLTRYYEDKEFEFRTPEVEFKIHGNYPLSKITMHW